MRCPSSSSSTDGARELCLGARPSRPPITAPRPYQQYHHQHHISRQAATTAAAAEAAGTAVAAAAAAAGQPSGGSHGGGGGGMGSQHHSTTAMSPHDGPQGNRPPTRQIKRGEGKMVATIKESHGGHTPWQHVHSGHILVLCPTPITIAYIYITQRFKLIFGLKLS